jgi:FkbM family methyltransferase
VAQRLLIGGVSQWFASPYFVPGFTSQSRFMEYVTDDNPELRFTWRFLQPGMTFLDIGAYHGIYSVIATQRVTRSGTVMAFEPSPRDRRWLRINALLNGLWRLRVEPYALGAQAGRTSFFVVVSGYTTMNSLRKPATDHPTQEVSVDVTTLDAYCATSGLRRIDLMKIDTEGGELDVFRGATAVLERYRPIIICEILDWVTKPWGRAAVEAVDYLAERGYQWFEFDEDGRIFPHARREQYPEVKNYLAVPQEKLSAIEGLRVG